MSDMQTAENMSVAAQVRAWMFRRGMNSSRVAASLGWTPMYLSRRLTAEVPFTVPDLIGLGNVLDIHPGVFLDGPEEDDWRPRNRGFKTRKDSDFVAGDVPLETVAA